MTIIAIPPRTTQAGHYRTPLARRRPTEPAGTPSAGASTLTVTFDIALGGEGPTPQAFRLLELVRDLVERGEGAVTVSPSTDPLWSLWPVAGVAARSVVPAAAVPADDVPGAVEAAGADPDALEVYASSRKVIRDGEQVPLTRLEFDLLLFLAEHPRRVFTRLQLLNSVWGYDHAVARTVDVHVRRLRVKIGEQVPLVTTVYGVGYRLSDEANIRIAVTA